MLGWHRNWRVNHEQEEAILAKDTPALTENDRRRLINWLVEGWCNGGTSDIRAYQEETTTVDFDGWSCNDQWTQAIARQRGIHMLNGVPIPRATANRVTALLNKYNICYRLRGTHLADTVLVSIP